MGSTQAQRQQRLGLNWPLSADGRGYFAPCRDEAEDIRQSVRHCVLVGPREQFMRMGGCDITSLVFEEVDEVFESLVSQQIRLSLRQEPRVLVHEVLVTREEVSRGVRVDIEVVYTRRGSRTTERSSHSATYST